MAADGASGALLALTCWTGGLATLAEKKSRRMELAHYCLARAIESFALCLTSWGYVRGDRLPRRTDVIIFSAATAAIMHCYSDSHGRHRDVFKSKYLNVLDFVFGNTGRFTDCLACQSSRHLFDIHLEPWIYVMSVGRGIYTLLHRCAFP